MSIEFNGAFSLGSSSRSKMFSPDASGQPGPGQYQLPNFNDKERSLKLPFSQGTRIIDYKNGIPGPGSYSNNFKHLDKQIAIKMGKPHYQAIKPATVGPGSYDPKNNVESLKAKQPLFSFGHRIIEEVKSFTPAPNAYDLDAATTEFKTSEFFERKSQSRGGSLAGSQMRRTKSSFGLSRMTTSRNGFGGDARLKSKYENVPGPGEYRPSLSQTATSTSFGKSQRNWLSLNDTPGPGAFDPKSVASKSSGYSLGQRLHDSMKTYETDVPGPGTYDGKPLESRQGIRFGQEIKHDMVDKESLKKPGPNYYYPLLNTNRQEIFVPTIGFSDRPPLSQSLQFPGPGEYETVKQIGEGPKWKMGAKIPKKSQIDNPGPGTYDMDETDFLAARPRFGSTKGFRSNPVHSEFINTGPGSYEVSSKLGSNKFGATVSNRFPGRRDIYEPGPGSYDIAGSIGKIPNYLMLSKKKHSQLLDFRS